MDATIKAVLLMMAGGLFGGLLTFFIAVLSQRKYHKEVTKEAMEVHIDMHHNKSITEEIDKALVPVYAKINEEKKEREKIEEDLKAIKGALTWLVIKQEGNPKELGLI